MAQSRSAVKDLVTQIKARVDCRDLFRRFWPDRFREIGNCHCPNPGHVDANPSCQVTFERAHCHAEGLTWDALDLHQLGTGLGFMDAVTILAAEIGINSVPQMPAATSGGPKTPPTDKKVIPTKTLVTVQGVAV